MQQDLCKLIWHNELGALKLAIMLGASPHQTYPGVHPYANAYPVQIACFCNNMDALIILLSVSTHNNPLLVNACVPSNSITDDVWPAIVYAIWHQNLEMIDLLVHHGVDLHKPICIPKFGPLAPLHWIVLFSTPAVLRHCLKRHVHPEDEQTIAALMHLAITREKPAHQKVIQMWIQRS